MLISSTYFMTYFVPRLFILNCRYILFETVAHLNDGLKVVFFHSSWLPNSYRWNRVNNCNCNCDNVL